MSGIKITADDRRYTKAIRERDAYTCQRCGRVFTPGVDDLRGLHTAHMFTRRCGRCTSPTKREHYCTRLDLDNAVAACYGCHQFLDSHPASKIEFFEKHLGQDRFEALADRAYGKRPYA